jgi:CTP:molybdopterin cytidylyltransferase MocA
MIVGPTPRIAALILAAGRSTRMGKANKLLADVYGRPMIARVAAAVQDSQADPAIVVTGYEREGIEAALAGQGLVFAHNPDFDAGLSSSLHRGLAALPEHVDGVVVCLGDMPRVSAVVIDRLIAAFDPPEGRQAGQPGAFRPSLLRGDARHFGRCGRARPDRRISRSGVRGCHVRRWRAERRRHARGAGHP